LLRSPGPCLPRPVAGEAQARPAISVRAFVRGVVRHMVVRGQTDGAARAVAVLRLEAMRRCRWARRFVPGVVVRRVGHVRLVHVDGPGRVPGGAEHVRRDGRE